MLDMLKSTFAVGGTVSVEIEETMDGSEVHLDSCAAFSFSRCFAALRVGGVLQHGFHRDLNVSSRKGWCVCPPDGDRLSSDFALCPAGLWTSSRSAQQFLLGSPKLLSIPVCLSQAGNINAGKLHFEVLYIWMSS